MSPQEVTEMLKESLEQESRMKKCVEKVVNGHGKRNRRSNQKPEPKTNNS